MNDQQIANAIASSPTAWVTLKPTVTENQQPLEFTQHRFLIDLYDDMHPDIVVMKSAQVGESTERIFKVIWAAKYLEANVIYVLPTKDVSSEFVLPKVNPIIKANPHIAEIVSADSKSLKQVGDRFIYFTGAQSESSAVMKSADILVLDELDRMNKPEIVNMFDSRLQASKLAWKWRLSNPSQVNYGVHRLWQDSDQRHWFITCHHCNHEWFIDFEQTEEKNHYVNVEKVFYACGNCDKQLSNSDRRNGRWVAKYPKRFRHGYWISQMVAPWVTVKRILEQKEDSSTQFFYNFVLGKPYTPADIRVDRDAIIRANAPSNIPKTSVAMGVDQDAGGQYYVLMTSQGVFDYGYVDSWEKIEYIKLMYNAVTVVDPNPYPTMPKQLADKYSDIYMCYFKKMDGNLQSIDWKKGGSIVYADRTRVLDIVANEIITAKLLFRQRQSQLEEMIRHWTNLYRLTEEEDDGRIKTSWVKHADKQSDYPFALLYARIALSQTIGGGSQLVEPEAAKDTVETNVVSKGDSLEVDFSDILKNTYEDME